jgi:hypothetical protein
VNVISLSTFRQKGLPARSLLEEGELDGLGGPWSTSGGQPDLPGLAMCSTTAGF